VDSRALDGRQPVDLTRMVNVGFPKSTLYGFEMVDTRRTSRVFAESRHQSKIYTESIASHFS